MEQATSRMAIRGDKRQATRGAQRASAPRKPRRSETATATRTRGHAWHARQRTAHLLQHWQQHRLAIRGAASTRPAIKGATRGSSCTAQTPVDLSGEMEERFIYVDGAWEPPCVEGGDAAHMPAGYGAVEILVTHAVNTVPPEQRGAGIWENGEHPRPTLRAASAHWV